ncbi:MAG: CinA family protein [Planctomycetota bacterium]
MENLSRAEKLGAALSQRDMSIAVAESCTGGLLGAAITAVPGSSAYFSGGIIAYSNTVKHELLGVDQHLLERFGAVSSECAEAMVLGLRHLFHCDVGVSVTGIAGPGGGSAEKPVGLVHAGLLFSGHCFVREYRFHGDRDTIRHATVDALLDEVLARI